MIDDNVPRWQADVERLKKALSDEKHMHACTAGDAQAAIDKLEAQLAAANALLVDALPANVCKAPWLTRRDEHFAACGFNPASQPATAPAANALLAAAERAVLDACAKEGPLKDWALKVWAAERARRELAELARRAVKP